MTNSTSSDRACAINQRNRTRICTATHLQLRHARQIHHTIGEEIGRLPVATRNGAVERTIKECLECRPVIGNDVIHESGRRDTRMVHQDVTIVGDVAKKGAVLENVANSPTS